MMTGRDLIIYILENGLEDEPVFKDGKFIGFINTEEAAAKMDVGSATVKTWVMLGWLEGVHVPEGHFIPATAKRPELEPRKD